jgi:hypothetical protein
MIATASILFGLAGFLHLWAGGCNTDVQSGVYKRLTSWSHLFACVGLLFLAWGL